jgi:hypothetical protein
MKQQYTVLRDDEKNRLIVREYAELDKDSLSLLCEESHEADMVRNLLTQDKNSLIRLLRTRNMYPPRRYMEQIADAVAVIYNSDGQSSADIVFEDSQLNSVPEPDDIVALVGIEEETPEIDDLLDDEAIEDDFTDDDTISNIGSNSSIKIADDESLDIEDDA